MRVFDPATKDAVSADPVSIGVIGCGRVATSWHLPVLRTLPGARIAAIADLEADRLERVGAQFEVEHRYRDPMALISDLEVEAVAICVPAAAHADLAVAALGEGKHLFVEKPLALTLGECDRMIEAAANSDVRTTVGFNLRHHRLLRRARELIRAGAIGAVDSLSTLLSGAHETDSRTWRMRRDLGGGSLIETGVHHFDLWRHLLDSEVEEVIAISKSDRMDDRIAMVTGRLSGGVLASSTFTQSSRTANELCVLGAEGRLDVSFLEFDGLSLSPVDGYPGDLRARLLGVRNTLRELPGALRRGRHGSDFDASYAAEWRTFLAAIRTGAPLECDFEDGRRALAVCLAAISSIARREPVRLADAAPDPVTAAGEGG
jgi:myo-inositol 2-dehydrogenase/D-chiro-inositol 1-dehydrogenase